MPPARLVNEPPVLLTVPFNVSVFDPTSKVPCDKVKALFTVTLLFIDAETLCLLIVRLLNDSPPVLEISELNIPLNVTVPVPGVNVP